VNHKTANDFDELIKLFLAKKEFALSGASADPSKYGNIILKKMSRNGYNVFPVNSVETAIDGITCFANIDSLPEEIKFINFVTAPKRSIRLLGACVRKGIEIAWFQPGAYDCAVIGEYESAGIRTIYGPCIMVAAQTCS